MEEGRLSIKHKEVEISILKREKEDDALIYKENFIKSEQRLQDKEDKIAHMWNISPTSPKVMATLTLLEGKIGITHRAMNWLESLEAYLARGTIKTSFCDELNELLKKVRPAGRTEYMCQFIDIFNGALQKYGKHIDVLPARHVYEQARVFGPEQAKGMSQEIRNYDVIHLDKNNEEALQDEWFQYVKHCQWIPIAEEEVDSFLFWESKSSVWPNLAIIALCVLHTLVSSCDVERSSSLYKHIMDDLHQSNSELHVAQLSQLHFNGDITGSLSKAPMFTS